MNKNHARIDSEEGFGRASQGHAWMKLVGFLITILSVGFVAYEILRLKIWQDSSIFSKQFVLAIAIGAVVYFANCLLLSLLWSAILKLLNVNPQPLKTCVSIFGQSQIARYVPGNIFHLVGRHALITSKGVSHQHAVLSTVIEFGCILFAAGVVALTGFILDYSWIELLSTQEANIILGICIAALLVIVLCLAGNRAIASVIASLTQKAKLFQITLIVLGYILFFLISGITILLLLKSQATVDSLDLFIAVVSVIAISWTFGFVTPGAPAGVGVREASLILLLTPIFGEEISTASALGFRFCTVLGELMLFGFCAIFFRDA